jgi:hypothetical protein
MAPSPLWPRRRLCSTGHTENPASGGIKKSNKYKAKIVSDFAALVDSNKDFATLLDERIARYQQMQLANNAKVIDAQPINGKPQAKPQIETKPPLARTPDRRFRRF